MTLINHVKTLPFAFQRKAHCISFPKSGNTYLRILLANYALLASKKNSLGSFAELNSLMPEYGRPDTFSDENLEIEGIRIIKSHYSMYTRMSNKNLLVHRDFVKVVSSYNNYSKGRRIPFDVPKMVQKIDRFVDHLSSSGVYYIDYDDLIARPDDTLRGILENVFYITNVDPTQIAEAVTASRREVVQEWDAKKQVKFLADYENLELDPHVVSRLRDENARIAQKLK